MKRMTLVMVISAVLLAVCNFAIANTYYVAKNGNDDALGGVKSPLLTIQAAIDKAAPGDMILVKKGIFQERLAFKRDGLAGKPITIVGELGAIIDGGTPIKSKWEKVEGIGNVYRTPYIGSEPYNLTWNNKYILHIRDEFMVKPEGMAILREGPSGGRRGGRSWVGVSAMWGTLDGYLYFGCGDLNIDPNNQEITTSPIDRDGGATVLIDNHKFITIRGFTIRNAYNAVLIRNNSSDCIIDKNTIIGGRHSVEITSGSSRISIRNNKITLGYVYPLNPDNANHGFIWGVFKNFSEWDRVCVLLSDVGSDNDVIGNYMYENFDGVQNTGKGVRLNVGYNIIENMADDGLEPDGEETDAQWHDNTVIQANYAYRHKTILAGPMYIYRNKFYSKRNGGIYWYAGTKPTAYFYQNTFATSGGSVFGNLREVGLTNVWLINNIFSCGRSVFSDNSNWPDNLKQHIDYNYFGGNLSEKLSWWGDYNKIVKDGQLWDPTLLPNFKISSTSAAREIGIDLSKPWTLDGITHPAMPGMKPGYFEGKRPDAGAIQYRAGK